MDKKAFKRENEAPISPEGKKGIINEGIGNG